MLDRPDLALAIDTRDLQGIRAGRDDDRGEVPVVAVRAGRRLVEAAARDLAVVVDDAEGDRANRQLIGPEPQSGRNQHADVVGAGVGKTVRRHLHPSVGRQQRIANRLAEGVGVGAPLGPRRGDGELTPGPDLDAGTLHLDADLVRLAVAFRRVGFEGQQVVPRKLARQSIEGARGPGHDIEGRATREAHQRLDPLLAQLTVSAGRRAIASEAEVHVAKGVIEDDGVEAGAGCR